MSADSQAHNITALCQYENASREELISEIEKLKSEIANLKKEPTKVSSLDISKNQIGDILDELPNKVIIIDKFCGLEFDKYFYNYKTKQLLMKTCLGHIKIVCDEKHSYKTITFISKSNLKKSCQHKKLLNFLKTVSA